MRPHLLRVERPMVEFKDLIAAVRHQGDRVGWLELESATAPLPPGLGEAAACGLLRAVAVGGGRSVAVKPLRGEPVLRDVLREHFRGCLLVLVRGAVDAPRIESRDGGWTVGGKGPYQAAELAAALRRPRPWD